jgi:hypothetical protein
MPTGKVSGMILIEDQYLVAHDSLGYIIYYDIDSLKSIRKHRIHSAEITKMNYDSKLKLLLSVS